MDDKDEPGRSPLVDPRLAGAGGIIIAAAALAWIFTQGAHQQGVAPQPVGSGVTASAVPGDGSPSR
ncbi:hypothetical protein [Streptacidiphilus albus]|uniref:hypothetical protein n=1 Tax=Streptacidiphilus albus TaxID=105425 RepID=UPI00054C6E6C|nr:hypothetical protein [Streptacidiphilus albus]